MKIFIENEKRKRIYIHCKNCGKYKKHKARGLCQKCYNNLHQKKQLEKFEKTGAFTLEDTEQFILVTSILDKYEWRD